MENNKEVTSVGKNDVIMTDISSERCDNDESCDSHGHSSRTPDRTCDTGVQPTDNCDIRKETNDTNIAEMITSLSSVDGGDNVEQSELEDGEISDSSTSSFSSCSYSESASSPDDSAHLASLPDAVDDGTTHLLLHYLSQMEWCHVS